MGDRKFCGFPGFFLPRSFFFSFVISFLTKFDMPLVRQISELRIFWVRSAMVRGGGAVAFFGDEHVRLLKCFLMCLLGSATASIVDLVQSLIKDMPI